MRHLRQFTAMLAIAAFTAACSSSPGASSGGESQGSEPSTGSQPSQAAASAGGGGGGANGSITYEITGDYEASGELPFLAGGISTWVESEGGWVANFAQTSGEGAYILVNTFTRDQILTYGDGTVIVAATSAESSGFDCTFNITKNDSSGLTGSMQCNDIPAANATTGAQLTVDISAEWDGHT